MGEESEERTTLASTHLSQHHTSLCFHFAPRRAPRTQHTMLSSSLARAVLRHVSVGPPLAAASVAGVGGLAAGPLRTAFSTYLDQGAVTDRVLKVVKAFDKVDPAKVSSGGEEGGAAGTPRSVLSGSGGTHAVGPRAAVASSAARRGCTHWLPGADKGTKFAGGWA